MSIRSVSRPAAVAGLLCLGAAAGSATAAPVVWNPASGGNGNSYEVVINNAVSWDAAQGAAEAAGGHLATITSKAEQSFIESVLASASAPTGSYWFGLRETAAEGAYQNINGESLPFTHWLPGEPNNSGGVENVGAVLWTPDGGDAGLLPRRGFWNDEPTSGYPADGLVQPAEADVLRGGYLMEIGADENGGASDDGGDGETPNAIPLPAAALTFPVGAAFAGLFYRRMRGAR